jgi:hypothetical protein
MGKAGKRLSTDLVKRRKESCKPAKPRRTIAVLHLEVVRFCFMLLEAKLTLWQFYLQLRYMKSCASEWIICMETSAQYPIRSGISSSEQ